MYHMTRTLSMTLAFLGLGSLMGCGTSSVNRQDLLPRLREAIEAPVATEQTNVDNSRLVEEVADGRVLEDMTRVEVEQRIGRGDPCSRHPRCIENGFEDDDWHYTVGEMGEALRDNAPVLIVGFDRSGRVTRVWNLRMLP